MAASERAIYRGERADRRLPSAIAACRSRSPRGASPSCCGDFRSLVMRSQESWQDDRRHAHPRRSPATSAERSDMWRRFFAMRSRASPGWRATSGRTCRIRSDDGVARSGWGRAYASQASRPRRADERPRLVCTENPALYASPRRDGRRLGSSPLPLERPTREGIASRAARRHVSGSAWAAMQHEDMGCFRVSADFIISIGSLASARAFEY